LAKLPKGPRIIRGGKRGETFLFTITNEQSVNPTKERNQRVNVVKKGKNEKSFRKEVKLEVLVGFGTAESLQEPGVNST